MESSATSINITGTVPNDIQVVQPAATIHVETKHNHKPNYGRYVEGCAACHAKYPNGAPQKTRKAKAQNDEVARLKAELAKAYSQQVEKPKSAGATDELVNIMLRREAKELREEEAQEERKAEARAQWLKVEQEQERKAKERQDNCPHAKPNGQTARVGSQIHNNGMIRPFCPHCGKVWPWQRPSHEQMPTSVEV